MIMSGSFKGVDCSNCNEAMATLRGCKEPTSSPVWTDIDGVEYFRCPRSIKLNGSVLMSRAYKDYNNGIYPVAGGSLEQSATLLDAFAILESALSEIKEIERKKDEKRRQMLSKKGKR